MISSDAEFCRNIPGIWRWANERNGGLQVASKRTELAIEKIVAACDGNMRGALEALLLVNEHLEAELHQLYAAVTQVGHPSCTTVH
ncbi:hypothetical protein [Bradyrhizobium sp.]|uniref:hypothetical protein n=1 Tax=Bradyrhizobium sp. TaxID=376 RepID=UPI000B107EB9|nr:hypothetical protein [Bradyrhizobium sp.]